MAESTEPFPITQPIVALIGPTAIGKTSLSIELAKEFDFEIISVDSMQVYRYMDIGTAKIKKSEMEGVPHHLIDVVDPDEDFDASLFEKLALAAILDIHARGKKVLLTGGTGLYLLALVRGMSKQLPTFPEIRREIQEELAEKGASVLHEQLMAIDRSSANRIHVNDSHRLVRALEIYRGTGRSWSALIEEHQVDQDPRFPGLFTVGLSCDRQLLYERINRRTELMLDEGLEEEVKGLLAMGYGSGLKSMRSIGYSHMLDYIHGEWDRQEMVRCLARDTRRYAKRQFTWFKRMEDIRWYEKGDGEHIVGAVSRHLGAQIQHVNKHTSNLD
ncbi:MAG: tRNA (adenosine(37)-N6)-dimethylallyltransferase MiaA [Thermodesulfobacteriota bacterium]